MKFFWSGELPPGLAVGTNTIVGWLCGVVLDNRRLCDALNRGLG